MFDCGLLNHLTELHLIDIKRSFLSYISLHGSFFQLREVLLNTEKRMKNSAIPCCYHLSQLGRCSLDWILRSPSMKPDAVNRYQITILVPSIKSILFQKVSVLHKYFLANFRCTSTYDFLRSGLFRALQDRKARWAGRVCYWQLYHSSSPACITTENLSRAINAQPLPSTCKLSHVAKILKFFTGGSINFRFAIMTMISLRLIEWSSLSYIVVATAMTVRGQLIRCTILQNVKYYLECSKMTYRYLEPII